MRASPRRNFLAIPTFASESQDQKDRLRVLNLMMTSAAEVVNGRRGPGILEWLCAFTVAVACNE